MTTPSIQETCQELVIDLLTSDPADVPQGYLKVRSVFGSMVHGDVVEVLTFAGRYWVSACGDIVSVHDEFQQAVDALREGAYAVSKGTEAVWSTQHAAKALAARLAWFGAPVDGYSLRVNGKPWRYDAKLSQFRPAAARPQRGQRSRTELG